jgi:hypothetical protein
MLSRYTNTVEQRGDSDLKILVLLVVLTASSGSFNTHRSTLTGSTLANVVTSLGCGLDPTASHVNRGKHKPTIESNHLRAHDDSQKLKLPG